MVDDLHEDNRPNICSTYCTHELGHKQRSAAKGLIKLPCLQNPITFYNGQKEIQCNNFWLVSTFCRRSRRELGC